MGVFDWAASGTSHPNKVGGILDECGREDQGNIIYNYIIYYCVCRYTYIYMYIYIHIFIDMHGYLCLCLYAEMYLSINICTYIYMCICNVYCYSQRSYTVIYSNWILFMSYSCISLVWTVPGPTCDGLLLLSLCGYCNHAIHWWFVWA